VGVRVGVPVNVAVRVGSVLSGETAVVHVTPGVAVPAEIGLPPITAVASAEGDVERCCVARQAR
jgi:hypothetical protein